MSPPRLVAEVQLKRFADQLRRFALVGGIEDLDLLHLTVRSAHHKNVFAESVDEDLVTFGRTVPLNFMTLSIVLEFG